MSIKTKFNPMGTNTKCTLTVITNPDGATCVLTYNGQSYTTKTVTVPFGTVISYSVSYSNTTTKTGSVTMNSNKTLTFTRTYSTNTTDQSWTQPYITSNGTLGSSNFAVSTNMTRFTPSNDRSYIYGAFQQVKAYNKSYHNSTTNVDPYVIFYSSTPIKVSKLTIYEGMYDSTWTSGQSTFTIYYSNNGTSWTSLVSGVKGTTFKQNQVVTSVVNVNSTSSYNYYKILNTSATKYASYLYWLISYIQITATTQQTSYTYYFNVTTTNV